MPMSITELQHREIGTRRSNKLAVNNQKIKMKTLSTFDVFTIQLKIPEKNPEIVTYYFN